MASPFAAILCIVYAATSQVKSQTPGVWPEPVITADSSHLDLTPSGGALLTYSGAVTVIYGVTTLVADTVTMDRAAMRGTAVGHVHITDPDGIIDAAEVEFTWNPKNRNAHIASLGGLFEGVAIKSSSADIAPGNVVLKDLEFNSTHLPWLFRVESPRLTYIAGKYLQIKNPRYRLLGVDIPWHKTTTVNQDPRVGGTALPGISYSHGAPGVNYTPSFLISPQTNLQGWSSVFRGDEPHYGVELAHSFLNPSVTNQGRIVPNSDLDTRFGFGYFDNVKIESPEVEFRAIRQLRNSIAFDSDVNQGANDRLPGGNVTKLAEVVYGNGGPLGALGQISNLRIQSVREGGQSSFTTRVSADTSIGLPPIRVLPDLETVLRFDAQGYAGDRLFGWARAQLGLAVNPIKPITLSAAYVTAIEEGNPDLTTDSLYNVGAWSFRGDAYFGSIRASYLLRYYLNGIFFDNEYEISQVVGALRVSVVYRTFPSDFRFGVTFRLDDMIENLKKHHQPPPLQAQPVSLY